MQVNYCLKLLEFALVPILLFAVPLALKAQSGARPGWTPELEMKVKGIGAVRVSPDGKKVAFNVRGGGEFQVAIVDLAGGGTRIVSSGENPVWGADSRHIIFAENGALYLLDTMNSRKNKILDGVGKITEPTWSR